MRRARLLAVGMVVATTGAPVAPAGASVAAGAATHTVTVSPSTGLHNGQTVTVAGTGFTETPLVNGFFVSECRAAVLDQAVTLDSAIANCDVSTASGVLVHPDGVGSFSTPYPLRTTFNLTGGASVDCTVTPCALLVSQLVTGAVLIGAGAPISFGPPPPPPPTEPWLARRPLVIAHAGGDLEAPHETLYAYKHAIAAGADMLEMDLRLSADHQLMVMHDDTLDRTTNATGAVRDLTVAQLQALDNGYWFVPNCWSCHDRPPSEYTLRGVRTGATPPPAGYTAADFTIPTFEQMLTNFPDRLMDIEIKDGPDGMAAAEALAARLNGSPQAARVVVVSFDDTILAHFHELAPTIATSPGLDATTKWFLTPGRPPLPGNASLQVPPVYSGIPVVSQQFVADAHAAHLAVWVWFNGNDDDVPAVWNQLLDYGVDGLITGKPAQLQAVLDARDQHFRVPLTVGRLNVHGERAKVRVECSTLAADRCHALLGVRAGDAIVGGTIVDLAPGEHRWLRIRPDQRHWSRLARRGLSVQWWGNDDIGLGSAPISLAH